MVADFVTPEIRSRMMAGIKGTNTKPELAIRSALHARGFRFRLHCRDMPGTPDIVFPKYRAVVFVHGCFWHGHNCHLFKWPKTRSDFWYDKINSNIARDRKQVHALTQSGWRVGILWECAFKGREKLPLEEIAERCSAWLVSDVSQSGIDSYEARTLT